MTDLQTELAEARAFQLRLAERIAAASEVLSHLAERKGETVSDQPEPVPRPLFEAALWVLRSPTGFHELVLAEQKPNEWLSDTAERIVRRAAACGVGEEG